MSTIRLIPRLDIKGANLVKGIHLEGLRVLGKPEEFAKMYYKEGADELYFQDVVASLYQRNSLLDIVSKVAKDIFIPLTVGGGIRTINDIEKVLRAGADKISINTAAIERPEFINESVYKYGSSTISVSVEVIKQSDGTYLAYTDNGREYTGVDAVKWAQEIQNRGAGEIIVTSIDNEGTGLGFDIPLLQKMRNVLNIPLVAHGGPGEIAHIIELFQKSRMDAICIASLLHYNYLDRVSMESDYVFNEGNTDYLVNRKNNKQTTLDISSIKSVMALNELSIRS